jgi:virginiamycin B lyase
MKREIAFVIMLTILLLISTLSLPFTAASAGTDAKAAVSPTYVTYDRVKAYRYAQQFWDEVCSDTYFWNTPKAYVELDWGTVITGMTGYDCAHFVSCAIGNRGGGGLDVPSRVPPAYGEPGAAALGDWLIASGNAVEKPSVTDLRMGDVINYDWQGDGHWDHVALYLDCGQVAAHTTCVWEADWQLGGAAGYRFIHILTAPADYEFRMYSIPTPDSGASTGLSVDPSGNVWFAETQSDKIVCLSPSMGVFSEVPSPVSLNDVFAKTLDVDSGGNIWYSPGVSNKVVKYDPSTGVFSEFSVGYVPYGLTMDSEDNVWFTEFLSNAIGEISSAYVFTQYPVPTGAGVSGICVSPDGDIWITEDGMSVPPIYTRYIGGLDRETGTVVAYQFPYHTDDELACLIDIVSDSSGNLWFTEHSEGKIGEFIPSSQQFIEYPIPSGANPCIITVDKADNIWFTEAAARVGRLDSSGAVQEFEVPTGAAGIACADNGIWFTMKQANKIGWLAPPPTPKITHIDPSLPNGGDSAHYGSKQLLSIYGEGFVPASEVTLSIGSEVYPIPSDRTMFRSSNEIQILAAIPEGQWRAWVVNPGSIQSNEYDFQTRSFSMEDVRQVFSLALQAWKNDIETAIIMTAIAGAESGYIPNAAGDKGDDPFNYGGYESWGLWQIHMPSQMNHLMELAGTDNLEEIAKWLNNPLNNVQAAYLAWKDAKDWWNKPFQPWTTYWKYQTYKYYLPIVAEMLQETRASVFKCPVNVTITDSYNRTISETENQIPGASFEYSEETDTKTFYVPSNLTYHVELNATAYGNITILQISPTENPYEIGFSRAEFNLTSQTRAYFDLFQRDTNYTLAVDENGDGLTDFELAPDVDLLTTEHDITVAEIAPSRNILGESYCLQIKTTVRNYGAHSETFNVTFYVNETLIEQQSVTLTNGTSANITFLWNTAGFTKGNYTLSVVADSVSGETYTEDNTLIGGWVTVTIPGDVDGDRDVDIFDIVLMAGGYGKPPWGEYMNCDIDGDGDTDILDIVIAAGHYGESG